MFLNRFLTERKLGHRRFIQKCMVIFLLFVSDPSTGYYFKLGCTLKIDMFYKLEVHFER